MSSFRLEINRDPSSEFIPYDLVFSYKMLSLFDPSGKRIAAVALRNCFYMVPLGFIAYDCESCGFMLVSNIDLRLVSDFLLFLEIL